MKMLRKERNKTKTVSEKVSELLAHPNGSDSSEDSADEATAPRIVDFDDDYELPKGGSTDFRKQNVKLLSDQSAKYKGKIASRKDFELEEEEESEGTSAEEDALAYEESDSEAEGNAASLEAFKKKLKGNGATPTNGKTTNGVKNMSSDNDEDESMNGFEESDSENEQDSEAQTDNDEEEGEEDDDEDDDDDDEQTDEQESADEKKEPTNIISKQNQQAELQKGVCVQNQLHIWERLLELRMNTQKLLIKTNKLPVPEVLQTQREQSEEINTALTAAQGSTGKLLKQLLELQGTLAHQFSELRNSQKTAKKRPMPFNGDAPDRKRLATHLQLNFDEFRTYRNSVLLRWDDRTKLLTPGAGAKTNKLQEDFDVLKKIENTLANRSVLVARSQTLKNDAASKQPKEDTEESTTTTATATDVDLNGEATFGNRNVNIYDDSDFYHQQLRELIEYKANTSTNMSEITKQYVELQKLRQKMKKKVDTRASKGRKIRYGVHNKLVNFMAPNEHSDWTDESKNELFKSLFV